jgi:hypothetical protein
LFCADAATLAPYCDLVDPPDDFALFNLLLPT